MRRVLIGCLAAIGGVVVLVVLASVLVTLRGGSRSEPTATSAPVAAAASTVLPTPAATPTPKGTHTVRYLVVVQPKDAQINITYDNETGGTAQVNGYQGDWDKVLQMKLGAALYLSAFGTSENIQSIHCEIQVDGKTVKSADSQGQYAMCLISSYLGL